MTMEFFDTLLKATTDTGNIDGLQYGIVADTNDPMKLQRVQVYDQAKGGKHKSGWLMRGLPFTNFSPPVPEKGDLVIFGYIMGDPHHGCYLGAVTNNVNKPAGSDDDFTITLGSAKVSIAAATGDVKVETGGDVTVKGTKVTVEGTDSLTLKANTVTFQASSIDLGTPNTARLSGKDLIVKGATDTRGDAILNKGW